MRWLRFTTAGKTAYGLVEGERVRQVLGDPFGQWEATAETYPLNEVRIEVPVQPRTFYAVGQNYAIHASEYADDPTTGLPTQPDVGYRANTGLVAHLDDVVIPEEATEVHYEGELVVVIGRTARRLSEADALSCVLGYTIGNDVSERAWQRRDRTLWRAKNVETFSPMGPWIETDVYLDGLQTSVRVNGSETISFPTNQMLFGVETFISRISHFIALQPGDVIWMGTEGVSPNLQRGDSVDISICGIGTLSNRFV